MLAEAKMHRFLAYARSVIGPIDVGLVLHIWLLCTCVKDKACDLLQALLFQ